MKIFSVIEAEELLPTLKTNLEKIFHLNQTLKAVSADIDSLIDIWGEDVYKHNHVDNGYYTDLASKQQEVMKHLQDEMIKINFSDFLSQKLNHDYTYMANLFSEVQGTTIEQFIISHKIERIKELIIYDELNITEIAWKMNYSSVAHLSNQFKKVTGLSPSHFKQLKDKRRSPIEEIGNLIV